MDWQSELYEWGFVGFGLALMIIGNQPGIRGTGLENLQFIGMLLVLGGGILTTVIFEWITKGYLCVQLHLEPSNKRIDTYIERVVKEREVKRNFYATTLDLHWTAKHPEYGEFKQYTIYHHFPWKYRVLPDRMRCLFRGQAIDHSQAVQLHCRQYSGSSDSYKDLSRPAFQLMAAPKADARFPIAVPAFHKMFIASGYNLEKLGPILDKAIRHEEQLFNNIEGARQASVYKSLLTNKELTDESRESTLQAVLSHRISAKALAWNYIMDLHTIHQSIENIVRSTRKWSSFIFNKWMAIVAVAGILLAAIILSPELGAGASQALAQNTIPIVALSALGIGGLAYYFHRKGKL